MLYTIYTKGMPKMKTLILARKWRMGSFFFHKILGIRKQKLLSGFRFVGADKMDDVLQLILHVIQILLMFEVRT